MIFSGSLSIVKQQRNYCPANLVIACNLLSSFFVQSCHLSRNEMHLNFLVQPHRCHPWPLLVLCTIKQWRWPHHKPTYCQKIRTGCLRTWCWLEFETNTKRMYQPLGSGPIPRTYCPEIKERWSTKVTRLLILLGSQWLISSGCNEKFCPPAHKWSDSTRWDVQWQQSKPLCSLILMA